MKCKRRIISEQKVLKFLLFFLPALFFFNLTDSHGVQSTDSLAKDRIQPYPQNSYYWQYKGEPILLIGGSWQDNLFNHPTNLKEHLDLLTSVGGNYVRNVMSHRNKGNVYAFEKNKNGKFDLDRFNEEYWQRFEDFLEMTYKRDIIVQIEIWATWDMYIDHQSRGGWSFHPFNPANNLTYTSEESSLPTKIDYAPQSEPTDHPFFWSVPALDNNELLLRYQKKFVDKMLSYTLKYPHILYSMNNETGERVEWGDFWINYVRQQAKKEGVQIETTDMRRNEDIQSSDHAHIYNNPDRYTFLDISQNNAWEGIGQDHYDNILHVREQIASNPRPVNNVKNYGASRHGEDESVARMARIIFGGSASARFHRPHPLEDPEDHEEKTETGLGLSPRAQQIIHSLRMVANEIDVEQTTPQNNLLSDREENEAYLLADPGTEYAIYFPDNGSVSLDISHTSGNITYKWLNLDEAVWGETHTSNTDSSIDLTTPDSGHWVVIIHEDSNQ